MNCATCDKPLGSQNTSGYCRVHFNQRPVSDETRAKRSASIKRFIAANPEWQQERQRKSTETLRQPEYRQARRENIYRQQLWNVKWERTPEFRAKLGRSISDTKLAHIPRDYRAFYRTLTKQHGYKASEAERLVAEMQERDLANFRASVANAA